MKKIFFIVGSTFLTVLVIAFKFPRINIEVADKIFTNGKIITVDANNTIAQAVAIKDGKIVAVGSVNAINKLKGDQTTVIDLQGKVLTPGFIDGHSHFMSLSRSKSVDVSAPPVGTVKN